MNFLSDARRALGLMAMPAGRTFVAERFRRHLRLHVSQWVGRIFRDSCALPLLELNVELTSRCNSDCSFCVRRISDLGHHDIDLDILREVIVASGANELRFSGLGEPFASRSFAGATEMARTRGMRVSFVTNGLLLSDAISSGFDPAVLRLITISIDAATEKTYASLRRSDGFDRAISGMKSLSDFRRLRVNSPWPFITINWILTRTNLTELPLLFDLLRERNLLVDAVHCYPLIAHSDEMGEEVLQANDPEVAVILSEARQRALQEKIDLRAPFYEQHSRPKPNARHIPSCKVLWESIYLRITGEYLPCCEYFTTKIGSYRDTFQEVWNGTHMRRARTQALSGKPPFPYCKFCHKLLGGDPEFKLKRSKEV